MTKRQYVRLMKIYMYKTDEELRSSYEKACKINNKLAREHIVVIEELLDQKMFYP